tara:strand:- start:79 stop:270 length:192 start_codon:yes stop_codon:yes gene_type:complete
MWAYASQLPQKEYKEWIEDGSTMEDVQIGPAGFDKFIKGRIPWVSAKGRLLKNDTCIIFFLWY